MHRWPAGKGVQTAVNGDQNYKESWSRRVERIACLDVEETD